MVYTFFKYLLRLALNSYFKTLKVSGQENIPKNAPIIFVANHPSTLMDPVVIGALLKPKLYFLAAAEFMGKGIVPSLMSSWFNMIPVYRPDTLPDKAKKNSDVFEKCYAHLAKNGSILIFPEGSSETALHLRTLKTGTARIVLGAEKTSNINVHIIPIGLNYTDPHSFQSDLFVNIGKPILARENELLTPADDFEKAKHLTTIIENKLKENIIHIEDVRLESLFEKIALISKHEIQSVVGEKPSLADRFYLSQDIQKGLSDYAKNHPRLLKITTRKLDNYIQRVNFYNITDVSVAKGSGGIKWIDYLKILLGIPVFSFGYITNAGPYFFSSWALKKLNVRTAFQGSIGLSIGVISYLTWYISWGIFASRLFNLWWVGIALFLVVYISGLYALFYLRLVKNLKQQGKLNRLLKRNRNIFESLQEERNQIIKDIRAYAQMVKS